MPLRFLRELVRPAPPPTALERIAATHAPYSPSAAALITPHVFREAIRELQSASPADRLKLALSAGLPDTLVLFRQSANPLFAYLLDDTELVRARGEQTLRAWLLVDAPACIAHVLACVDALPVNIVLIIVIEQHATLDTSEVFDAIAPRLRKDADLRIALTRNADARVRKQLADPRFLDVALDLVQHDIFGATRLLAAIASPRAIDELRGLLDGATVVDGRLIAAFDGLRVASSHAAFIDVLAHFVIESRALSALSPMEIAQGLLCRQLAAHGYELSVHERVRSNARALEIVRACIAYPMPVIG